jgi:pSer/pThr/pTyr-binding forkhead associated (FHA) protein
LLTLRALIAEMRSEARAPVPAPAPPPVTRRVEAAVAPRPAPTPAPDTASIPDRTKEPLPPRLAVLRSAEPDQLPIGTTFPITAVATIGRGEHNSVPLRGDQFASNNHALVYLREGAIYLRDRGSTNGTLVNGARLEDEALLHDGDRITIGTTELQFNV